MVVRQILCAGKPYFLLTISRDEAGNRTCLKIEGDTVTVVDPRNYLEDFPASKEVANTQIRSNHDRQDGG